MSHPGNPAIYGMMLAATLVAGAAWAAPARGTEGCSEAFAYDHAVGMRQLSASELSNLKGYAWKRGGILYLDVFNGNGDITLSSLTVQLIPGRHQGSESMSVSPALTGAREKEDRPCDSGGSYYTTEDIHHINLSLPPDTARQLRIRTGSDDRSAQHGQFTWRMIRAEGYYSPQPYNWRLWR